MISVFASKDGQGEVCIQARAKFFEANFEASHLLLRPDAESLHSLQDANKGIDVLVPEKNLNEYFGFQFCAPSTHILKRNEHTRSALSRNVAQSAAQEHPFIYGGNSVTGSREK
jgi:hypothetical protein